MSVWMCKDCLGLNDGVSAVGVGSEVDVDGAEDQAAQRGLPEASKCAESGCLSVVRRGQGIACRRCGSTRHLKCTLPLRGQRDRVVRSEWKCRFCLDDLHESGGRFDPGLYAERNG